ncbi:MAG: TonB-dependent receptor, partial [Chitinophagaceae bacterium]|nr:TonB-dependent receptor [Chitinophagaceae bacterium]
TRTASTALWFKNSNYFQGANLYSLAAELNSTFGKAANTLRATYTFQNDSRSTDSQIFPFVDILSNTGGVTGPAPYTSFGYEPFSFGNLRQVKTYSVIDNLSWTKGKNNWTVGGQFELSETINGFQRFATSYYVFNTWADFANGNRPRDFAITYSLSKNFAPAFSAFKFGQYSAYAQDEINVNKDLRVTLGLRVDLPTYPDVPQIITHPLVKNMNFEKGEVINTGNLPKNRLMWSPRVGFNWDLYGDRSLQIRGGTGVFTGRVPFVWIVSQSGDNGMIQVTQFWNNFATPGPFNPNPAAYRPSTVPTAGTIVPGSVTALVQDFKNPQTWKTTLAIDTRISKGIIGTLEAIFNKDLNTAIFRNPNMIAPAALNIAGYPDNRPIYGSTVQTRFINTLNNGIPQAGASGAFNPVVLDNGNRGYYFSLTAKIERQYSKGLAWSVAYTKSMAANLFDGGGDQPLSAWQGTANVFGPNAPALGYADYVVPDRVIATLSYRKEYFKHLATTISAFYNGATNGRFSYVYDGDFNRDGVQGNDLIYIPTAVQVQQMQFVSNTVNGVTYSQGDQRALFERYIQQDKYLRAHRGQYAERNGAQLPWLNRLDVKILQDLFTNIKGTKNSLQFSIDIFNAGNLVDPGWGKLKTINNSRILAITNATSIIPGGTVLPIYRLASANGDIITKTFRDNVSTASTYSIQFGLRYLFN